MQLPAGTTFRSWPLWVASLAVRTPAESLISQIGWRKADARVIFALLSLGAGILLILVVFHLRRKLRERASFRELSDHLFAEEVGRHKLTEPEARKLRHLAAHRENVQPHILFQSISLYERCVHDEIRALEADSVAEDRRQLEESLLAGIRRKLGYNYLPLEHPLVSTRNISVGQAGSLFGKSHRTPIIRRAVVVENNEFFLGFQYDVEKEETYRIFPDNEIKFAFARRNDGVYGIPLRVLRADGDGTIRTSHTLELKRNQLRQFVRIEVSMPAKFRLLKTANPEKSEISKGESVDVRLSDISGGGLSFLCERSLKPGDVVSMSFGLPGKSFAGIAGQIVRTSLQEGKTATHFRHHVKFLKVEPVKQERIVRFVFEKQRQVNQWR